MSEWISIMDKEPRVYYDVLAYCTDGNMRVVWWDGLRWIFENEDIAVIYWMPLPEPPKE